LNKQYQDKKDERGWAKLHYAGLIDPSLSLLKMVEFLEKVLIPFAEQMKEADRRGEKLELDDRE